MGQPHTDASPTSVGGVTSEQSYIDLAEVTEPNERSATLKRKRGETCLSPLEHLCASLHTLEKTAGWLDDNVVNCLVRRLRSDRVGVVDSLYVTSGQLLDPRGGVSAAAGFIKDNDLVLISVCHRNHWRLWCWSQGQLEVWDSASGLSRSEADESVMGLVRVVWPADADPPIKVMPVR